MRKAFLLWALALGCPLLQSQTIVSLHGSLVVIVVDKDRIVAGADSLSVGSNRAGSDTSCKLTLLGDQMFFSATNITHMSSKNDSGGETLLFDAHSLAKQKFATFGNVKNADARTLQIATAWGSAIRTVLTKEFGKSPIKKGARGFNVLNGIFVATDGKEWTSYRVSIDVSVDNGKARITSTVEPWIPKPDQIQALGADAAQMVGEFFEGRTPRARTANAKYAQILKSQPGIDALAFKIESAIAAVEQWAPASAGIGGDVDVLELPRDGKLHWLRAKDNCRQQ